MLEAFVAAIRDPSAPKPTWVSSKDSVANLQVIEKVYAKVIVFVLQAARQIL
jgi:hypothetical protein